MVEQAFVTVSAKKPVQVFFTTDLLELAEVLKPLDNAGPVKVTVLGIAIVDGLEQEPEVGLGEVQSWVQFAQDNCQVLGFMPEQADQSFLNFDCVIKLKSSIGHGDRDSVL